MQLLTYVLYRPLQVSKCISFPFVFNKREERVLHDLLPIMFVYTNPTWSILCNCWRMCYRPFQASKCVFSLSSLIRERKEIFCVYVIKESIATSGNVRKCHLCYRPLGDARDARQASAPPLRRPSDLRSPQSPTSSHPPYRPLDDCPSSPRS